MRQAIKQVLNHRRIYTFEVSFQLQGQALSGLEVDSMEVSNVKYKPYKGVRYITRSGFFQIRT